MAPTILVEMRAGLLEAKGGRLNADSRRGLLQVVKYTGDDQVHLVWQERPPASSDTASSQLDWPVLNSDRVSFKQVKAEESRPTDPVECQPTELPIADLARTSSAAAPEAVASAPVTVGSRERGANTIQASDLAAILSNIGVPAPAAPDPRLLAALLAGAAGGQLSAEPKGPSLNEVLRSELLLPLLRDPEVLPRLAPYLPEEHRTQMALEALVVSAQFRSQLDVFGAALQSGQLDLAQFGLQAEGYSVAAFLESIQQQVDKEQREGGADA